MRARDSTQIEIVVEGHLNAGWSSAFQGMNLNRRNDGTTVIRGPAPDQAALFGLLRRIRDAGMSLIAVKHIPKEEEEM